MATQKKTTNSPSRKSTSKKAPSAPQKTERNPVRREVGALVCFILSVFSFLSLAGVEAWLIDIFGDSLRALVGWGFLFAPFALLLAAFILLFHRGRPIALRVGGALLFPAFMGIYYHLFAVENLPWGKDTFDYWLETALEVKSGGLVCGTVTQALRSAISTPGTFILIFIALTADILIVFRLNPVALADAFRNRPRREYPVQPEPEPKPPRTPPPPRRDKAAHTTGLLSRRPHKGRSEIDIPIYEGDDMEPDILPIGVLREKDAEVKTPAEVLAQQAKPAPVPVPEVFHFSENPPVIFPAPEETDSPPEPDLTDMGQPPELPPLVQPDPPPDPQPVAPLDPPPALEIHQEELAEFVIEDTPALARPYQYPSVSLLSQGKANQPSESAEDLRQGAERLIAALANFSISATISNITRGPSVTRYEIELGTGVRLSSLQSRADDIALALGAVSVGIAPITGKINVVGVEVPNKLVTTVFIREMIESRAFQGMDKPTAFVLGRDIGGNHITADMTKLVHLLIAGTTGSGKSVCVNSIIVSLLFKASPEELKFIMVDPKMVELGMYNGIPHLLTPVVSDSREAAEALDWAVVEMDKRYKILMENGKRDIDSYNAAIRGREDVKPLPRIVIIIDEMADLMMVARKEVETAVARIAQKARACGVHLILATQRPEAKVVTGIIKANIPSRIALSVRSGLDSRIMLDETGAEKLVGKGDMLFLSNGAPRPTRVQGCWVSDQEVASVVAFLKEQSEPQYSEDIKEHIENAGRDKNAPPPTTAVAPTTVGQVSSEEDPMLPAAIEAMLESGQGSVSYLQRRLKLGYARAARLMDMMEERGIVGPFEGSKPRQVLITPEEWARMKS